MIHSESDHEKHEGDTADLEPGNHENDFQEALDGQVTGPISTGCVYSDVESAVGVGHPESQDRPIRKRVSSQPCRWRCGSSPCRGCQ